MDAENKESCLQRDSAERKGYVRAHRSFNRIWKERDSAEPDILGCGKCEKLCSMNNIKIVDKKVVQNNQCTMCYRCIKNCPKQAMTLLGKKVVEQSVIEKYL